MKKILCLVVVLMTVMCGDMAAQQLSKKEQKAAELKAQSAALNALVESKNYMFVTTAQTSPSYSEITDYCGIWIAPNKFKIYIPTWQQCDFETPDFTYEATPTSKGGWNVVIKARNQWRNIDYTFKLAISPNGNTNLDAQTSKMERAVFSGLTKVSVPR